jgi:hypothetical protein
MLREDVQCRGGERENWRGEESRSQLSIAVRRTLAGRPGMKLAGRTPSSCSYAGELVVVARATSPSPPAAAAASMGERA